MLSRSQARFNLPALPTGDEDLDLPPPPRVPSLVQATAAAAPIASRRARSRKGGGARAQFMAGLLGGVAFVLTPTLVLAGHLVH